MKKDNHIDFLVSIILVLFNLLSVNCFAQDNNATEKMKIILPQNKIGGVYVTDLSYVQGVKRYFQSLSFKYNTDSFYYWRSQNITGKGTYQIFDNKLILTFENSKIRKKASSSFMISEEDTVFKNSSPTITVNCFYTNKLPIKEASIVITSANGKKIIENSVSVSGFPISLSDFPLTISGFYINTKPIRFELSKPGKYKIDLFFQLSENEIICNNETWIYILKEANIDRLDLQKVSSADIDYFDTYGKWVNSSYRRY